LQRAVLVAAIAASSVASLGGCQDDIETPFPAGLEPLEDNKLAANPDGPFVEELRVMSSNTDMIRVYARGFVLAPIDQVWEASKNPEANVAKCSTTTQTITPDNETQYESSFLVHYVVNDILTVEWDDQWRYGRITPELGMIKHQKVQGSDFISLSEGTIQVLATSDPGVTELSFVEHLEAIQATASDVVEGVQHNYDALVAVAHGNPIPPCP
jgi:hypothetical protein